MTPLAHRIAKEMTLPVKRRALNDTCGILPRMGDVHCFEVTDVLDAAGDISLQQANKGYTLDILAFLPAPKTWIEWRHESGERVGVLLEDMNDGTASARWVFGSDSMFLASEFIGRLKLRGDGLMSSRHFLVQALKGQSEASQRGMIVLLYSLLAMINTPRIIGRTTHMPHAGLQRRLVSSRRFGPGKFPLRAWTEIKLKVGLPKVDGSDQEIWLNGSKALHFVRSHLRVRLGQLEFVSAHWRGDPALGIKQSRYKLVAA